ncbi:MAG: endonuclease [Planctomycetes bacterium]|nr:endonuclease [Planctomycetota bacterium]
MSKGKVYAPIIEAIFLSKYQPGARQVDFVREDITRFARSLKVEQPKNLGDLVYSFRYRATMPEKIGATAPKGEAWIIRSTGQSRYRFVLVPDLPLAPNGMLVATKVPDSTPGVVAKYSLGDEQGLLARVRYNRLIDIFTGVACYSLQSHLRTTVPGVGAIETDELYVGIDRRGAHYVIPVQAKGGSDKLGLVQIEQDFALCAAKFPSLIPRPIAAQFMQNDVIAMFGFEYTDQGVGIAAEKHYQLVPQDQVSAEELRTYSERTEE